VHLRRARDSRGGGDKTLGMLLATPVDRIPFLLAKTVAMIVHVLTVALLLSDSPAGPAKLSPWYYFNSGDPLANGADPGQLLVLGAAALVILTLGLGVFNRRDLRG